MAGRPSKAPDTSTFTGKIGAEIRRRRERKGLSVAEVAESVGVPAPTWYHWEAGRQMPLERLPAIAEALGCKVKALIPE